MLREIAPLLTPAMWHSLVIPSYSQLFPCGPPGFARSGAITHRPCCVPYPEL